MRPGKRGVRFGIYASYENVEAPLSRLHVTGITARTTSAGKELSRKVREEFVSFLTFFAPWRVFF